MSKQFILGVDKMRKGSIFIYYGQGRGKTTLAIGQGIRAVGEDLSVIMVQFLDYNNTKETIPLKKLEPEFKIFRFEKMRESINSLSEVVKKELEGEIKIAFQFTKKILETGECDLLILDGIIDAIERNYIEEDALCEILDRKQGYMDVILTGSNSFEKVSEKADFIYNICTEKKKDTCY